MSKIQNSKKLSQKIYILYNKLEKLLKAEGKGKYILFSYLKKIKLKYFYYNINKLQLFILQE